MNLLRQFPAFFVEHLLPGGLRLLTIGAVLLGERVPLNMAHAAAGLCLFFAVLVAASIAARMAAGVLPEVAFDAGWVIPLEVGVFFMAAAFGHWWLCAAWGFILCVHLVRSSEDFRADQIRAEQRRLEENKLNLGAADPARN